MTVLTRSEELILLSVWKLQAEAYGAAIRNHLSDVTGEDWPVASVYGPLDRLAGRGFVKTRMGEPTPERGGRRKRYFKLTAKGVAALNHIRAIQDKMWASLPVAGVGTRS